MNNLGLWLISSSVPVTLFALAGVAVYLVLRRGIPAVGALTAASTLMILMGVSALAFTDRVRWWTIAVPIIVSPWQADDVMTNDTPALNTTGSSREAVALPSEATASIGVVENVSLQSIATHGTFQQPELDLRENPERPADKFLTWRWPEVIGTMFVIGISLASIRFLLGLWMVHRYRVCSVLITAPALLEQAQQMAHELGFDRRIEFRQSHTLGTPATVGWRHPLVLLPANWEAWSDEERRVVLAHEIAHIARGDYLMWLFAQVSLALHFYHPLVHWLARRLRLEQELAADILGAQLAGGRELYLVTLARMVLRQNARKTSWAAQPFLPQRGTFLRRIEMLSEDKSLHFAEWSRSAVVTLVGTLACLGLIIAGVRVSLAEPPAAKPPAPKTPAATPLDNRAKLPADKQPEPTTGKPEKPLTLDELQSLVKKQLQSIRSLHVTYTNTDPAEFGGKSHEHIWAEQGSKLLRRDISKGGTAEYSVSFDGKQTYRVLYLGDQPAGREIGDQYASEVFNSFWTSMLGWMHPHKAHESLLEAVLAPNAKVVDEGNAAGAFGPTIEVKNYRHPDARYGKNVTIILDREHDYLPRSFAFHSVKNPTWQFAYEIDKFEKIRDGLTGEDRWFPMKGHYKQQTPERGQQIFTTTIDKVRINETLPDELFVLPGDELPPPAGQEEKALAEFHKLYRLDDKDQIVKFIRPPFVAGRMLHLRQSYKSVFNTGNYDDGNAKFPSLVYFEQDGKIETPSFHATGSPFFNLRDMLPHFVRIGYFDDPGNLLTQPVMGDFIVRKDTPSDKILDALGPILDKELNIPVKFALQEIDQPLIVIRGRIKPPFAFKPETVLELSAKTSSEDDAIKTGNFSSFVWDLEQLIEPGRRVVSEIENAPAYNDTISWRASVAINQNKKGAQAKQEAQAVLDRLEKQTGLKFTLESRKYPTILVRRIR